jgi:hypothetical protein
MRKSENLQSDNCNGRHRQAMCFIANLRHEADRYPRMATVRRCRFQLAHVPAGGWPDVLADSLGMHGGVQGNRGAVRLLLVVGR